MNSPPDAPNCPEKSPHTLKRKRSEAALLTPPLSHDDPEGLRLLSRAVHVLSTAAAALSQVTLLYEGNQVARDGLLRAVECLSQVNHTGGKLIICGVGKSGLVGTKMVATMKSLGLGASFLHAAEAAHGDLGDVRSVRPIGLSDLHFALSANATSERRRPVCFVLWQNARTFPRSASPG
jgi:hypothetical protein